MHSLNHSSEHTVGICQMETAMHPAYAVSSSPRAILQRDISILEVMTKVYTVVDGDTEPVSNPEVLGMWRCTGQSIASSGSVEW